MWSNLEGAPDWGVIGQAYFHLARFAGLHYVAVGVKGCPPFIDAVVGIIPREEITKNPGAFGVLGLEVG